jgi:hypothetical protein
MFRLWSASGGNKSTSHLAFFMDRQGVANKTMLAASPDAYIMAHSKEAVNWARRNLLSYLNKTAFLNGTEPRDVPEVYEWNLEALYDEVLSKRRVTYGGVSASAFVSMWCNW